MKMKLNDATDDDTVICFDAVSDTDDDNLY